MSYAAETDIAARYGSNLLLTIADPDGTGAVNAALVTQALSDADQLIDSHVQERYQLPMSPVPSLLVTLAVDIAVYRIATLPTDEMRNRYQDALKLLKNIATGTLQLGATPVPQSTGQQANLSGPPRVFGRCNGRPL